MTFKFIHTADWQIGKRFGAFDDETAARLRAARISVIERIAQSARDRGAVHILVAGDIFDREGADPSVYQQPIAKLKSSKDLIWHLIPGNHDAVSGSIWGPIIKDGLPSNVRLYSEPGIHEIADGIDLLVSPLMSRTATDDPTRWMDSGQSGAHNIRIGLAHGSVADFGAEASVLIDKDRAQKAQLDYLALGDWHGLKEIDPRTYYSGTPEPDSFMQNDPGFVLSVELDGEGSFPRVERIKVGQYYWHERLIEIAADFDQNLIHGGLDDLASEPDHLLLKFRLKGTISPEAYGRLDQELIRLGGTYGALIRNEKRLETRVLGSDLESLKSDPTLHLAAMRLSELNEAAGESDKETSGAALKRLFVYLARLESGVKS